MNESDKRRLWELMDKITDHGDTSILTAAEKREYDELGAEWDRHDQAKWSAPDGY